MTSILRITGGPKARLAWAGARARRLWALKAKYTFTGGEGTGEGVRGTRTSACYLDFVSCPGLSNFLGPPLLRITDLHTMEQRNGGFASTRSFGH
jgi:hypothetical protein